MAELIKCFIDAGVPAGVVNMLTGHPQEISETVMDSDLIRKVTFTGSLPIGRLLAARAAEGVKPITLELGGHGPVLRIGDNDEVAKDGEGGGGLEIHVQPPEDPDATRFG